MEHYRRNEKGKVELYPGYFCMTCGRSCGMMGHMYDPKCVANPTLVAELLKLNK
jgi:hypothetical protein